MAGQKRTANENGEQHEYEVFEKRQKRSTECGKKEGVEVMSTENEHENILATADASVNYVSMLNVAIQRHRDKFVDLEFVREVRKEAGFKRCVETRCFVNVRKEDGNIDRKINTLGAEKHDAARRMILKMLEIYPELSFLSKQGKKKKSSTISGSGFEGKTGKQLLNELVGSKVLVGDVEYDKQEVDVDPDALEDNPDYAVKVWKVICSVVLATCGTRIAKVATAPKKKDAERESAELVVKEIREKFSIVNEAIANVFDKLDGKKKTPEPLPLLAANGNGKVNADDSESEIESICEAEDDEYDDIMRLFCGPGEIFEIPEDYEITVAHTAEEVEEWVEGRLQESGEYLGVYIESGALHNMLSAPSTIPRVRGIRRAGVFAVAGTRGALVCERDKQNVWPPRGLVHILQDPAWRKGGILASNEIREVLKTVVDLQAYAYTIVPERIETCSSGTIHLPLDDLVHIILNKSLGDLYGTKLEGEHERKLKLGMRARPAVKIAAISLALYARISRLADARIRNQSGVCALAGFQHLAEQLAGLTPLDS